MDRVDEYCKLNFGNDRKKMILTLISLVENNSLFATINDKLNLFAEHVSRDIKELYERVAKIEATLSPEVPRKRKISWKGFNPPPEEEKKDA